MHKNVLIKYLLRDKCDNVQSLASGYIPKLFSTRAQYHPTKHEIEFKKLIYLHGIPRSTCIYLVFLKEQGYITWII